MAEEIRKVEIEKEDDADLEVTPYEVFPGITLSIPRSGYHQSATGYRQ